jgi:hypothetical protein
MHTEKKGTALTDATSNCLKNQQIFPTFIKTKLPIKKFLGYEPKQSQGFFNKSKKTHFCFMLYKTNIIYDRDNFYLSDIITKSSITMGKCSALFKNHNFFN